MNQDALQLKSTRHCKYQSGHHFVWIPFKRRKIFKNDEIIAATQKYIVEAIENNGMTLIAIEVARGSVAGVPPVELTEQEDKTLMDHVHVFVSIPPRMSASQAVNIMKGYSSRHLRKQFDWLKKLHDKPKLWASSYYWGTTGNVSAQAVKRYIEECQG
jgi:putative transposase